MLILVLDQNSIEVEFRNDSLRKTPNHKKKVLGITPHIVSEYLSHYDNGGRAIKLHGQGLWLLVSAP